MAIGVVGRERKEGERTDFVLFCAHSFRTHFERGMGGGRGCPAHAHGYSIQAAGTELR